EMSSSNSLRHLALAAHDSNGSHNLALAFDDFQTSATQIPPGGTGGEQTANSAGAKPTTPVPPTSADFPTTDRQIIYRASLNLQVKSFADTETKISALVKASDGFVSQFSEDRSSGAQRGGRWTVRLPVTNFAPFLDSVTQLGIAERREVQSQD